MGDIADFINDSWPVEDEWYTPPERLKRWKFDCIVRETDEAWLIKFESGFTTWFPKSRCMVEGTTLYLPRWLKDRKIEEYSRTKRITLKLGDKKI